MAERVAIVGGARTPFVKAGTTLSKKTFIELGIDVVRGVVNKLQLDPKKIDEFIFGTVLLDPRTPNYAREIIVGSGLPLSITAHAISNNCISGLVAANMIGEGIKSGRIRIGLAGGAESMSRPALSWKRSAENFFLKLARARSIGQKLAVLGSFRPGMLAPIPPSPKEPSTGLTMGQHCELSAQEFGILRQEQDQIAFRSHQNAARAQQQGYFAQEIIAVDGVDKDNIVRGDTSLEKLARLSPVFDRSGKGTITAGNSSPLTDGASVVCLMAESEAKAQGREILGYIDEVEFAAIPPHDGLLMAPGLALPRLMKKANLKMGDVDRFEVHEAFAAQVACNMRIWEYGWKKYPEIAPIGKIPEEKLNVNGGSIAIGHPFAATGARLILAAANELKRSGTKTAVISVCAAGGMACAMVIRR